MTGFLFHQASLRNPYFQLAWEEALALEMPNHSVDFGIRIWRNHKTIVLGISEKEAETVKRSSIERFHSTYETFPRSIQYIRRIEDYPESSIFLARRASGGGTVLQSIPENINFSLFVDITKRRELYPIPHSYDVLLGVVKTALGILGVAATTAGKSDISIHSETSNPHSALKKISGNAQFRKRNVIVQHGTLILDERIIPEIESHQLHPPVEPDYRKSRSHSEFLTCFPQKFDEQAFAYNLFLGLAKYCGHSEETPLSQSHLQKSILVRQFLKSSLKRARFLCNDKYSQLSWILRK